jgi:hypothetical protein
LCRPDNWLIAEDKTSSFLDAWVNSHIDAADNFLKTPKPVLFEEFGEWHGMALMTSHFKPYMMKAP